MRQTARSLAHAVQPRGTTDGAVDEPTTVFEIIRRRNDAAIHAYAAQPLPRFDGTVTCILAQDTALHGIHAQVDPRLAWRHTVTRGVTTHTVPGTHLSMLDVPHVDQLARALNDVLTPT